MLKDEIDHRALMAKKHRVLEQKLLDAKIAEADAAARKAEEDATALEAPRPAGPVLQPTSPVPKVVPAPATAAAEQVAKPEEAPAAEKAIPRLAGILGDTAVFDVNGASVAARVGDSVEGLRVRKIDDDRVLLTKDGKPVTAYVQ